MIYTVRKGQVSYGEAVGILLLDSQAAFIPGDVANASSYDFPVRFRKVAGFTVARAIARDPSAWDALLTAAKDLVANGVRAVTSDCGFMGIHQPRLAQILDVPVLLSSLLQAPFIERIIPPRAKIGVLTADSRGIDDALLSAVGVRDPFRLIFGGMQDWPHFREAILDEVGFLDSDRMRRETVEAARSLVAGNPDIRAFLLECSVLPPYAAAVREATELPVFDFQTMIRYAFSAVVPRRYSGFM